MHFKHPEAGHWTSRLGIIALQYSNNKDFLKGAVSFFGDSLQEQRLLSPADLMFKNLPNTRLYSGPTCSNALNCGFMGIGAVDLYRCIQELVNTTTPGRAVYAVGTNDTPKSARGRDTVDRWHASVDGAVRLLISKVGGPNHVLVETMPYALDGTHDVSLIDAYNQILTDTAVKYGTLLYDIRPRLFDGRTPRPGALAADNIHLGGFGFKTRALDEQKMFTGQPV